MPRLIVSDGTEIYYKDWGSGPAVVLSHGWPLNSDSWESQMAFLVARGYRCIAHDRRGHGRSGQPSAGNDMNTWADDLSAVIERLGLRDVSLIGFSAGGGEVARYIGRHGTRRLARVALIASVTPLLLRTEANPSGVSINVFDRFRTSMLENRADFFRSVPAGPFYGFNRLLRRKSRGLIDWWWHQAMTAGFINTYQSIAAFSETDFTSDLARFDVPTLIIHGDDDQVVPIDSTGRVTARLIPKAEFKIYHGAPHGLTETHKDRLNDDLLDFLYLAERTSRPSPRLEAVTAGS